MDPLEFLLWLVGIVVIGGPLAFFGAFGIIAGITIWRALK